MGPVMPRLTGAVMPRLTEAVMPRLTGAVTTLLGPAYCRDNTGQCTLQLPARTKTNMPCDTTVYVLVPRPPNPFPSLHAYIADLRNREWSSHTAQPAPVQSAPAL
jgi:hypothetical protein